MKVVVLVSWVSRGGGTNLAFEVIDGRRRRGITVVPVVLQLKQGERLPDQSWRCVFFGGDYRNPLAVAIATQRLCRILKDEQPDLLESFLWNADLIGGLACTATRVRHLSYVLDRREWFRSPRIVHRVYVESQSPQFSVPRQRDSLPCRRQPQRTSRQSLPLRSGRVRLARNAVDINKFRRRSKHCPNGGPLRIGSLSRLVPKRVLSTCCEPQRY